jgi:uncharacterized protein YecE (DUF72 family)
VLTIQFYYVMKPDDEMPCSPSIYVGCAGWSLRTDRQALFPHPGSHLQRYAARFNAVEINSSFYRAHRPATYTRWAKEVPDDFRFSVKVPKAITHIRRLDDVGQLVRQFLSEVAHLENKLGPLLVQLPPTLPFQAAVADEFFADLRHLHDGAIVCEPRHTSWFNAHAEELFLRYNIARVAADPALTPEASKPGGIRSLVYFRWHGSPIRYYSNYEYNSLSELSIKLRSLTANSASWCIFDNTADGAAIDNALSLLEILQDHSVT